MIDANLKIYVLNTDSKIRPFIMGGGGYSISSLTYPNQLTSIYGGQLANQSYNSNAFLGEIGVGLDVRVSKTISIGAMFKFNDVLSSNNGSNNIYYYNGANAQQALTGASLQQSSFSRCRLACVPALSRSSFFSIAKPRGSLVGNTRILRGFVVE